MSGAITAAAGVSTVECEQVFQTGDNGLIVGYTFGGIGVLISSCPIRGNLFLRATSDVAPGDTLTIKLQGLYSGPPFSLVRISNSDGNFLFKRSDISSTVILGSDTQYSWNTGTAPFNLGTTGFGFQHFVYLQL